MFEAGLTRRQARQLSVMELFEAIEGARYRAFRESDAVIYSAWVMVRAWVKRAPSFSKMLGRKAALKYKLECLGRSKAEEKKLQEDFNRLRRKIEERDNGHRGSDRPS